MGEFVDDVEIPGFCEDHGIRLVAYFIGPDPEDFAHVEQIVQSDVLKKPSSIFFLNEGVIRQGQTTDGVFDPLTASERFEVLASADVRTVFIRRLTCMSVLRDRGLGFYDAIEGKPDCQGVKASPTLQHMVKRWLQQSKLEHTDARTADWLP